MITNRDPAVQIAPTPYYLWVYSPLVRGVETMCLPEATIWSIPCAFKGEPVGDIEGPEAFERSGLEGKGGEHPFYRWLLMEGTTAGDAPAKVRLFPKDFLPGRQLRLPEVARILMEAAGRDP